MKEYTLPITKKEILVYLIVFISLYFSQNLNTFLLSVPLFSVLVRVSFWDIKYSEFPSYLMILSFLFSFLICSDLMEGLRDGLMFCGGMFIFKEIIDIYLNYIKPIFIKEEKTDYYESMGEGDLPIIGTMGILFGVELGLSCIFLSACIGIIMHIITRKEKLPFVPSMAISILITFVFKINLFNFLLS